MTLMGHEATEQSPGGYPPELPLRAPRGRMLAAALAGLGPVLMLVPDLPAKRGHRGCDERLAQACDLGAIVARVDVDPLAGSHEELLLPDACGIVRLRLVRLPESDWLGWDRALGQLDAWIESGPAADSPCAAGGDATIRRAVRRQTAWRAHPVRLHLSGVPSRPLRVQPLAQCSWAALRVIEALRASAPLELARGA